MFATYLPANDAWCLTFGDSIVALTLGEGQRRFWVTLAELRRDLASVGLGLRGREVFSR